MLLFIPGMAEADFFTFNAASNPTTGAHTPVGSGHYTLIGEAESFFNLDATDLPVSSDQAGVFRFAQAETIPTMPGLSCTYPYPIGCSFNSVKYFSTPDGTPIAMAAGSQAGVGIYDSSGDPLALMYVGGGPSAIYNMLFITSATNGTP